MPQISPVVRCTCGKLHVVPPSGWGRVCPACGADLHRLLFRRDEPCN